jgi:DNA-binding NarL/FixJ family response regulator
MNASPAAAPSRLRVAVACSDADLQARLTAFLAQCAHELVDMAAAPDVVLTDGTADILSPASAVAVGRASDEDFGGLLPSDANAAQIDAALRAVAAGLTVRLSAPQGGSFRAMFDEDPVLLTPREIEVLAALGNGLSNKAAARSLGISPHTVKFHIESLFRKLGASSRAEAVAKGLKRQIVEF